ncbi:MAG: DUF393 domain-containing protein [Solirubrobacteraceae bacterium]|nr:DUF393 domain-containing protein [Solirubrobacteraceae bacterium]
MHYVFYDRDCNFCAWALSLLLRWDRAGELVPMPLQSPDADPWLGRMDDERRTASWHLGGDDRRARSGGEALADVLALLPGGRPLSAVARQTPGLTDHGYRWVAGHRVGLSRLVPTGAKRAAWELVAEREGQPPPLGGLSAGSCSLASANRC